MNDDAAIEKAAQDGGASDVVKSLPSGGDTMLKQVSV